jgi:meiotic recombination protein SPO11
MSTRSKTKKKHPREVSQDKLQPILKEREIIKKTKRMSIDELPDGIHEIRDISREEGMDKIEEIFKRIFYDTINTGAPILNVPSRSSSNVIYDEESDLLLLGQNYLERKWDDIGTVKKFTAQLRILEIIHSLLNENVHGSKREVYYMDVDLFEKDQNRSDTLIEDAAVMLGTYRKNIHVTANDRGLVVGRVSYLDNGDLIDCTKQGSGGKNVNPMQDHITNLESDAEFILVVEKQAAFLRLAEDKFYEKYPCVILTGSGQPNVATRIFLRRMSQELDLPVFAVMDSDPYGLDILRVYGLGSKALSYESYELATPNIKWLGVRPSDLDKYNLPESTKLNMSKADISRANAMMEERFIKNRPEWIKELKLMVSTGKKAEIQALASRGIKFFTDEYLPTKIETGDWV